MHSFLAPRFYSARIAEIYKILIFDLDEDIGDREFVISIYYINARTGVKVFIRSKVASKCSDIQPGPSSGRVSKQFEANSDPIDTVTPV